jgi:hypothetical protein
VSFGKLPYLAILLEVLLSLVLDIVINCHDDLSGVVQLGGTNGHEFLDNGGRIIMGMHR